jgi:hypothetical protein
VKHLIKFLIRRVGYDLVPIQAPPSLKELNPDVSDREWEICAKVAPFTMLSTERILANFRAVAYVVSHEIPGDIVECGVWRGGSSMAMALALETQHSRRLWMYDTYAGMTDATDADLSNTGVSAAKILADAKKHEMPKRSLVLAFASLQDVRRNMQATGYPMESIKFVKGPVVSRRGDHPAKYRIALPFCALIPAGTSPRGTSLPAASLWWNINHRRLRLLAKGTASGGRIFSGARAIPESHRLYRTPRAVKP